MRPKHLKSPFKWVDRHVVISDRVWYVPNRYSDFASFTFPGWENPLIFEKKQGVCLEYCSGNGAWVSAKAQAHPEYNWAAIECNFDRVRKIWSKIKNFDLVNLLAICGEGHTVTKQYFPDLSIKSVYINFPDPWPKKRHAKYRIIQPSFIEEVYRILEPEGMLTIVTDDEAYSERIIETMLQFPAFQSLFESPYYTLDLSDYGSSYFEDLWRDQGKDIRYHVFLKTLERNRNHG